MNKIWPGRESKENLIDIIVVVISACCRVVHFVVMTHHLPGLVLVANLEQDLQDQTQ